MAIRADETRRLGCHTEERGDRRGGTLVSVGGPGVERHGADLEGEADDHEHDADTSMPPTLAPLAVMLRSDVAQQGAAGNPVQQAHPVEHDRAGEHAEQVVLHARLVALRVPLAPRGHHVGRDRQELEGDEHADQVARTRHHHHAEHAAEQQHVVLALVVLAVLDLVGGEQHDDVAGPRNIAFRTSAKSSTT